MIVSNDQSIWVRQKYTFKNILTEQYHREANFVKILRNIVDFSVDVRIHVRNS